MGWKWGRDRVANTVPGWGGTEFHAVLLGLSGFAAGGMPTLVEHSGARPGHPPGAPPWPSDDYAENRGQVMKPLVTTCEPPMPIPSASGLYPGEEPIGRAVILSDDAGSSPERHSSLRVEWSDAAVRATMTRSSMKNA